MRKQRLISRLTLAGVALVTAGAFAALAFTDSTFGGGFVEEDAPGGFSWERLADTLPALSKSPPEIFAPRGNDDPLFPNANTGEDEDVLGSVGAGSGLSEKEVERRKEKIEGILKEGDRLLRSRRFHDAENTFMEAVKIEPSLKDPLGKKFFDRAQAYERQRAWSRAKLLYRISLHFDYENAEYHKALAATSRALGDTSKAAEHERLAKKFAR